MHPRQHPLAPEGNARHAREASGSRPTGRRPVSATSPGHKPVYVGDTLEYRGRLAQKIDLKSRPDRGIVATDIQARNQKGEIVFTVTTQILAERREPYRPGELPRLHSAGQMSRGEGAINPLAFSDL